MTAKQFLDGKVFKVKEGVSAPESLPMFYDKENDCISYADGQWAMSVLLVKKDGFLGQKLNRNPHRFLFSDLVAEF